MFTSTPVTSAVARKYYSYNVDAIDPDGDAIKYSLAARPSNMIINSSTGVISWYASRNGTYNVSVKATDSKGNVAYQNFTITVGVTATASSVPDAEPASADTSVPTVDSCDVNRDGSVTVDDIKMILAGRGTDDLTLDIDGDGAVSLLDSRVCISQVH